MLAWRKAARGKRGTASVARFEYRAEEQLSEIREQLLAGTYQPGVRPLPHQGPEVAQDQRHPLSRPGRPPRAVQRHRAPLRAAVHPRQLRQPQGQGHAPGRRPAAELRPAVPLRAARGHRPALRIGRSRDPARYPSPANSGGGRDAAGRGDRRQRLTCSMTNIAMCALPATTCSPSAGRAACRSTISPRSSGPTATCTRSTSSSPASSAAAVGGVRKCAVPLVRAPAPSRPSPSFRPFGSRMSQQTLMHPKHYVAAQSG